MFNLFLNLLRKKRLLQSTSYLNDNAEIIFGKNVEVYSSKSSKINLNGKLLFGIPVTGLKPGYAHNSSTILNLEEGANLIINGDVQIAPGCTIRVGKNAILELGGNNIIAHNSIIIATRKVLIGKRASISWNTTLIDDDGHSFYRPEGKKIKRIRKELHIGKNVGIQMNVVIPTGGKIGNNSIISANTVIRNDIPENTLVYCNQENKLLDNFTTGFQLL